MGAGSRVVIVTGAGLGIGRTTALRFAAAGARVAVLDVSRRHGEETVRLIQDAGGDGGFFEMDVSRAGSVEAAFTEVETSLGPIKVLVNNAGIYTKGDVLTTPVAEWDRILAVNLTGAFLCSQAGATRMVRHGGGVIVNVASEAGLVGIKGQVAYNVSKAGVIALTKSTAVDLADRGIRVNCICPGTTETPLVLTVVEQQENPRAARRALESCRPLNRLGTTEEIAHAIVFLASDEVAYTTGAVLSVDGGYTAQ